MSTPYQLLAIPYQMQVKYGPYWLLAVPYSGDVYSLLDMGLVHA